MSSQSKRWLRIIMGKEGEDGKVYNVSIHADKAEGERSASACSWLTVSGAKAQANRYQLSRPVEKGGRAFWRYRRQAAAEGPRTAPPRPIANLSPASKSRFTPPRPKYMQTILTRDQC